MFKWRKKYKTLWQIYRDTTASYELESKQLRALIIRLQTKIKNQTKLIKKLQKSNNI